MNIFAAAFRPDSGQFAYVAQSDDGAALVIDGAFGPPQKDGRIINWSPASSRFAYGYRDRSGWRFLVDGQPGPVFGGLYGPGIAFQR